MRRRRFVASAFAAVSLAVALCAPPFVARAAEGQAAGQAPAQAEGETFSPEEIVKAAGDFFGGVTEGLAKAIEHVFQEQGRPNAYVAGQEVAGAFFVGLRYGYGTLTQKVGVKDQKIYWQGPSVGFDFGGDLAKTFVLIYRLKEPAELHRRFPGVEGSFYFVAGVGVNYQQYGDIVLAPIRTGVGLRAGANVGYLHYLPKASWNPF